MFTKLPLSSAAQDVQPGSLALIPGQNLWALGTAGENLFLLNRKRSEHVNGKVADFGASYELQVDPLTATRASYPWMGNDAPNEGQLIAIGANGETGPLIVLGTGVGSTKLYTFDVRTGTERSLGSDDSEGLAYKTWRLCLRCSDAPGDDLVVIFSVGPTQD